MSGVTLNWYGAHVKASEYAAAGYGLHAASEHLLAKSRELVPVAPVGGGYLRDSGVASVDEGSLTAAVSYITGAASQKGRKKGGGNLAVIVHEDMSAQHSTGQAKYLEIPLASEGDEIQRIIADELKKAF